MYPRSVVDDRPDSADFEVVPVSNIGKSISLSITGTNNINQFPGEFGVGIPFPAQNFIGSLVGPVFVSPKNSYCASSLGIPALANHVVNIILGGSQKEMIGSNARGIVALVQHIKSIWDRTIGKFPGVAMSANLLPAHRKPTIINRGRGLPFPTTIWFRRFLNVRPETFFWFGELPPSRAFTAAILGSMIAYARRIGIKRLSAILTSAFDPWHLPLLKGDTHVLGRLLLRESASKDMGVINKKQPLAIDSLSALSIAHFTVDSKGVL